MVSWFRGLEGRGVCVLENEKEKVRVKLKMRWTEMNRNGDRDLLVDWLEVQIRSWRCVGS